MALGLASTISSRPEVSRSSRSTTGTMRSCSPGTEAMLQMLGQAGAPARAELERDQPAILVNDAIVAVMRHGAGAVEDGSNSDLPVLDVGGADDAGGEVVLDLAILSMMQEGDAGNSRWSMLGLERSE